MRARPRTVDTQRPAFHCTAIEGFGSSVCGGFVHFHKAESARLTGFSVTDQFYALHRPKGREQSTKLILSRRERKISNV